MNFLLVGVNEKEIFFGAGLEELYDRLAEKQNLKNTVAFDSVLALRWGIYGMPHIIIVDPEGIVRSITNGQDLTEEKLRKLIAGEAVTFYDKEVVRPRFDINRICQSTGSFDSLVMHHSLLMKWKGERNYTPDVEYYVREGLHAGYEASMVPLYQLYNLAFTGMSNWILIDSLYQEVYPMPVLEIKDKSLFDYDYVNGEGYYNYYLRVPASNNNKTHVMGLMQADLERVFGYSAAMERRSMTVWKLIAQPGAAARLKNKGAPQYGSDQGGSGGAAGFTIRNETMESLLALVQRYIKDGKVPFFDETGITTKIDITIDALMTDLSQIKRELQKNGLDLVKGKRTLNVIVIRDAAVKN